MQCESHRAAAVAFGGLITLAAAMGVGRFVYTLILPFMVESLELTDAEAGVIASSNFFGYLLGALLATKSLSHGGGGYISHLYSTFQFERRFMIVS